MDNRKRHYSMDILRILATVLILFHHYQQVYLVRFPYVNFYDETKPLFSLTVEFFFVLSGYFAIGSIIKVNEGASFISYYGQKCKRLLPVVAVSVIVYEAFIFLATRYWQGFSWVYGLGVNAFGALITMLGIQSGWGFPEPMVNYSLWYVSVLLWCYIVLYVIVFIAKKLKTKYVYYAFVLIFIGVGIFTYSIDLPFLNNEMGRGYIGFFTGIVLYELMPYVKRIKHYLLTMLFAILIVLGLTFCFWNSIAAYFNYVYIFIVFPALIALFDSQEFNKLLNWKPLEYIGKATYDIYVWHMVVMLFWQMLSYKGIIRPDNSSFGTMIIYSLICIAVGLLSYGLFSKRITTGIDKAIERKGKNEN